MESNVENKSNVESKCKNVLCFFKGDGTKVVQEANSKRKEVDLSDFSDSNKLNVVFCDELRDIFWHTDKPVMAKDLKKSMFLDEIVAKYGTEKDKDMLKKPQTKVDAYFIAKTLSDKSFQISENTAQTTNGINCKNIANYSGGEVKDMGEYEGKMVDILYFNEDNNKLHEYIGEINNKGERQGKGIYDFGNGEFHIGCYKNNKREGKGFFTKKNGATYVGDFKGGLAQGEGTYTDEKGKIYTGVWNKGIMKRDNIIISVYGERYIGGLKDGKRNGYGKKIYKNGDIYEGMWENDKYHGFGKLINKNNGIYIGEFSNFGRDGYGIKTYQNGTTCEGYWEEGKKKEKDKEGKKEAWIFTYKNGDKYKGEIENDTFGGVGTFDTEDFTYEGECKNDKPEGYGIMTYKKNGDIYAGEWKEGKKNGFGEEFINEGNTYYQGNFKNGARHGKGVQKHNNEITIAENWREQKIQNSRVRYAEGVFFKITDGTKVEKCHATENGGYYIDRKFTLDEKIEWNPEEENYAAFMEKAKASIKAKEELDKKNNNIIYSKEQANQQDNKKGGQGGGIPG